MNHADVDIPVRARAKTGLDSAPSCRSKWAHWICAGALCGLGPAVDAILSNHDYPLPVAKLLGEAIVLTVMLGSALKFEGRFILQTQSDGPVRMLVVDFTSPSKVRACARFDADRVPQAIAAGEAEPAQLLGKGHLAMTIDQGPDMSRYQGLVPLEGKDLEHAAHEYFLRSEQIPTRVRVTGWRRNFAAVRIAYAGLARAKSCCSSCPNRSSGPAKPISILVARRELRAASPTRGRRLGRRPFDRCHRGRHRVDRSGPVERASRVSLVP